MKRRGNASEGEGREHLKTRALEEEEGEAAVWATMGGVRVRSFNYRYIGQKNALRITLIVEGKVIVNVLIQM